MSYTQDDYAKLSIRHSLIEDALRYATEKVQEGIPKHKVLDSLESLFGLTDKEAYDVYRTASYLAGRTQRYTEAQ